MKRDRAPTRADRVHVALRADILGGRRLPGARLPFVDLTTSYQASMGVMREVLSRLAAEGLVQAEPQHGYRVVPISLVDLEQLTEARVTIETLVLRKAIDALTVDSETEIVATHHRLARSPQLAPGEDRLSDEWTVAHSAFHHALLAACPNHRLLGIADTLRDAAELYRQWSVPLATTSRDIAAEHRAILDAVLARESDRACDLLAAHIRTTTDALLKAGLVAEES